METSVACAAASSTAWRTSLVCNPFVSPEIMSVRFHSVSALD
ncbi:MAG: hypothetical protein VB140_08170 [Burkholderia sp.]